MASSDSSEVEVTSRPVCSPRPSPALDETSCLPPEIPAEPLPPSLPALQRLKGLVDR
jgi:hypothetical protein